MENAIDKRRYFIVIEFFKWTTSLLSWNAWIHLQCNRFVKSISSMQNLVLCDWLCWIEFYFEHVYVDCRKNFREFNEKQLTFQNQIQKVSYKDVQIICKEFEKSQSNIRFDVCRNRRACEETTNENYENVKTNQEFTKSIR